MNSRTLFVYLLLTPSLFFAQDCPPDELIIQSQAALDQFKIDYPNCTTIVDDVEISGVSNFAAFSDITNIEGNFDITNCPQLENLSGLENLKAVFNRLSIRNNDLLTDLSALNNLESVGTYWNPSGPWTLLISSNNSLRFVDGFENLLSCGNAEINVGDNPLLESIDGFNKLVNGQGIRIERNDQLTTIGGFNSLTGYGSDAADSDIDSLEHIQIYFCPLLRSFDGFSALEVVSMIAIAECNALESFPFEKPLTINHRLAVYDNENMISFDNIVINDKMERVYFKNQQFLDDLSFLKNLTEVGRLSILGNPGLKSLEGLTSLKSVTGSLIVADNPNLVSLGGQVIDSIGVDFAIGNGAAYSLQINNNDQLVSCNGLKNLQHITGSISVSENETIKDVNIFENIELKGYLPTIGDRHKFRAVFLNNPLLNKCDYLYICNGISFEFYSLIANGADCSEEETVLNTCNSIPRAQIFYFIDLNGDGLKDSTETVYNGSSVRVDPIETEYFISDPLGPPLYLDEGNYDFLPQIDQSKWEITSDHSAVNFGPGEFKHIEIGIRALYEEARIEKSLFLGARCNTTQSLFISAKNVGTENVSGTLWLSEYPQQFQSDLAAAADRIDGNRLGWILEDLAPSHSFRQQIKVKIPGPPEAMVGESLTLQLDAELDNTSYQDESFVYYSPIMCSWDPNDKLVEPSRPNNEIIEEDTLSYTIRFQNTGNDYAEHVFIIDSLDTDFLDINSINILASSHPDKLVATLERPGILRFDFPYIFLPDSTSDVTGSQGFVTFKIGIKENSLEHQDVIRNNADIYFDFNPPVRTNTTQSRFVNELSTAVVQQSEAALRISPNPTSGRIEFNQAITGQLDLLDLSGKVLFRANLRNQSGIDLTIETSGLYFLKIKTNRMEFSEKVVINK